MFERALPFGVGFAAIALSVLGLANAQTPAASSAGAPQTYRPGLGDLMTMTVQPRHIKLGLAGQEKNWTYAAYELHELEEAFERTAQVWPMYRKTNIAELMEASMKEPMEAVSQAIKLLADQHVALAPIGGLPESLRRDRRGGFLRRKAPTT